MGGGVTGKGERKEKKERKKGMQIDRQADQGLEFTPHSTPIYAYIYMYKPGYTFLACERYIHISYAKHPHSISICNNHTYPTSLQTKNPSPLTYTYILINVVSCSPFPLGGWSCRYWAYIYIRGFY